MLILPTVRRSESIRGDGSKRRKVGYYSTRARRRRAAHAKARERTALLRNAAQLPPQQGHRRAAFCAPIRRWWNRQAQRFETGWGWA